MMRIRLKEAEEGKGVASSQSMKMARGCSNYCGLRSCAAVT